MSAVVELRGVSKSYGWLKPRSALLDTWLRVEQGECFGLAGPNGAGKTTLIRLMLGLSVPDEGEALLFGLRADDPELRRRVGFVPEAAELSAGSSPRQLLRRWASLRSLSAAALDDGLAIAERLGLAALLDRPVGRFSKGERQRTLLTLAMLGRPELLVLDEPTDGLDPLGRALVRQVLREECAAGRTVFLNSHLLSETERVCSRVGMLHQGRLKRVETLRSIAASGEGASVALLETAPSQAVLDAAQAALVATPSVELRDVVRDRPGVMVVLSHPSTSALNTSIDALRTGGANLLELRPLRADLEVTLARVAGGADVAATATDDDGSAIATWSSEALAPVPPVPLRPWRAVKAIGRVVNDIIAELRSQRVGWMLLLVAVVAVGVSARVLTSPAVNDALKLSKASVDHLSRLELTQMSSMVGSWVGVGLFWALLTLLVTVSSQLVLPFTEARRVVLLVSQPVSKSDHLLGLYFGLLVLAGGVSLAYTTAFWLMLRWLGALVSWHFLGIAALVVLAFAPLCALVMAAVFAQRSGLLTMIAGIGTLSACVALKATRGPERFVLFDVLDAFAPKLAELGQVAARLGEGGGVRWVPVVSTALIGVGLLLLLVTFAKRREL